MQTIGRNHRFFFTILSLHEKFLSFLNFFVLFYVKIVLPLICVHYLKVCQHIFLLTSFVPMYITRIAKFVRWLHVHFVWLPFLATTSQPTEDQFLEVKGQHLVSMSGLLSQDCWLRVHFLQQEIIYPLAHCKRTFYLLCIGFYFH